MAGVVSSFLLVAASEFGDKTQLLAFSLAARFRRPWVVMGGIFVATVLNHLLAAEVGALVSGILNPRLVSLVLGVAFLGFGLWTLKPDTLDDEEKPSRFGPFLTAAMLFFFAEMGDKTQLATVALGARYQSAFAVTLGTTAGMMVTDGLAVWLGDQLAGRVQSKWIRWGAAGMFFVFGITSLVAGIRWK